jgi:spermidine synthase
MPPCGASSVAAHGPSLHSRLFVPLSAHLPSRPRKTLPHGVAGGQEIVRLGRYADAVTAAIGESAGDGRPVVVDRRATPRGELVLRRAGEHFEVIAAGTFLMDTRDGRSERALVREAVPAGDDLRVLLGGLGVGFSLDEALGLPGVAEVVVVEIEPAVVEWARSHLRGRLGHGVDDPRVRLVTADLGDALGEIGGPFDAICLDIDNGPEWLVHPQNAALYEDAGLERLYGLLRPGGRLAVWAAAPDEAFAARLRRRFTAVRTVAFPVPRGPDDVVYVAEVSPSTSP